MYGNHLKRFVKLFGEDRLLLIDFAGLDDNRRVLGEITDFVGAPSIPVALPHENASPAGRSATYDRVLARLRDFYRKADDYESVRSGLRVV